MMVPPLGVQEAKQRGDKGMKMNVLQQLGPQGLHLVAARERKGRGVSVVGLALT